MLEVSFAERLSSLRARKGLTQETLAEKTGLSVHGISDIERGLARPRPEMLSRFANALDVSIDVLSEQPQVAYRFSDSSLRCIHALKSTLLSSSRDIGWTSVLVDHHRVNPHYEPFETHATPDQTIVVMTRGEQEIGSFNAGAWRHAIYRVGTVGMTPGGKTDRLQRRRRRNSASFEKVNLYVPQRCFQESAEHFRKAGQRACDTPLTALAFNDPLLVQTVYALLRGMEAGAPDLYAQTAMQWLSVHLLSVHSSWLDVQADRRLPGAISNARLAGVVEYMSAHLDKPISLENLAGEAGTSKFHFARLFRESIGTTPHAFLVRMRMEAAQRMLQTTDLSISEIATNCGFAGLAYFGSAFTKHFGVAPTVYRARLAAKSGQLQRF